MLAAGEDLTCAAERFVADAAVLLRQEIHRKVDTVEFAAGNEQVARGFGAAGQGYGVVFLSQLARIGAAAADMRTVMKGDALGFHLRDAAVDDALFHLEVGNAVAQKPAGLGEFLEHMHVVSGTRELLRASHSGGAGTDDRDLFAGLGGGDLRLDPAVFPGAVDDRAFDGFDLDRIVVDVEGAGGFARRRADAAGEFRKIVGRMQVARGFLPVVLINQVVEVGDLVVDRTARGAGRDRAGAVAIGNAAIHAARGLVARFLLRQRDDEFLKILQPFGDRRIFAVVPFDFQKTGYLAHLNLKPLQFYF